jgi:NAD(P) transhydrogenase
MALEHYDLIVIGSGPAGEKGAAQAAYFGKKVALVEKESVPGGCAANTGTLPSKTLRETALFLSGFRHRDLQGLHLNWSDKPVTVRDFMAREKIVVEHERARISINLERHKVFRHEGCASFVDPHTIAVRHSAGTELQISADVILVATGSKPFQPPGFHFEDPRIYDSDEILWLSEIPESMVVVGGGVIGCEYACMFAALGIHVTIVERTHHLIGFLDREISAALRAQMEKNGIRMILDNTVEEVNDSQPIIRMRLKTGEILDTHSILVSSGRQGNTGPLGLDKIGIAVSSRGLITVNENFQTTVPHVYAAGDVIGFPALASTAMEQARAAMVYAFQLPYSKQLAKILPFGIYTVPECSMAGETEESLKEKEIPYVVGKAPYSQNARGIIIGDDDGFLKLLFREDNLQLLGVHVIGEQATELVHIGLLALIMNEGADLFIQTCFNYPTLSDLYKYATYNAMGNQQRARAAAGVEAVK